jgi:hypothetical protein
LPSISRLLGDVKVDIISTVGGAVSSDLERLIWVFTSNSEQIEGNFCSLRQRIDDLEHNVI